MMGLVQIATNRTVQGIAECERALSLDRKFGHAHGFIGLAKLISVVPRKLKAMSTRRFASLLAIPAPTCG